MAYLDALHILFCKKMPKVRAIETHPIRRLTPVEERYIIILVSYLVKLSSKFSRRICFIRSFVLLQVLCKWGKHVVLNIGLRNLGASRQTEGHSWLTLADGTPFMEQQHPNKQYAVFLGEAKNGVRYWTSMESTSQEGITP